MRKSVASRARFSLVEVSQDKNEKVVSRERELVERKWKKTNRIEEILASNSRLVSALSEASGAR